MKLLIKIPTRERGYDFLKRYTDNITNPDTRILLSIDNDQPFFHSDDPRIRVVSAHSQNKIHAINRDINEYPHEWDVLLVGSDDMWPQVKGFDDIILSDMAKHYPDTDGCLWYDSEDLDKHPGIKSPKGSARFLQVGICMLPVMGRAYYDRFGYVYHSAYTAFFCDDEYTAIAKSMNKITYIQNRIITHEHPDWCGGMERDSLYRKYNPAFDRERRLFNERKRRGFPA